MLVDIIVAGACVRFALNVVDRIREKQIEQAVDSLINIEDKELQKDLFVMMKRISDKQVSNRIYLPSVCKRLS